VVPYPLSGAALQAAVAASRLMRRQAAESVVSTRLLREADRALRRRAGLPDQPEPSS
jgi:hypothetical protein